MSITLTHPAPDFNPEQLSQDAAKLPPIHALLLDFLRPSPTNPRKHFAEDTLAELVESVKKHGVLQPILVRLWPANLPWGDGAMPLYEIVAGERRYRAAKAAELLSIPGMVRQLTDAEVIEIQLIENLQREDLHPLEEAEGYKLLMDQHGYSAEQLAEKIGKSKAYIYASLKLTALTPHGRDLFYGGLLTASTALLAARIPVAKLQDKAIDEITERTYRGEVMSFREAKDHIRNRYMLRLADAPFPRGDRDLVPKAGRCFDCEHRTGNHPELYADVDNADICTNPDCFTAKKLAHREREEAAAKAKGCQVITGKEAEKIAPYGVNEYSGMKQPLMPLNKRCEEDPENRTYAEIVGTDAAVTLLEDVREKKLVRVMDKTLLAQKLEAAGIKSRLQASAEADAKDAEKRKKEEAKVKLENAYRERLFANIRVEASNAIADACQPVLLTDEQVIALTRLLTAFFFERAYDDDRKRLATLWEAVGKNATERVEAFKLGIPNLSPRECWRLLIDMACVGQTTTNAWSMEHYKPERLLALAEVFGLDPDEIRKDVEGEAREKAATPRKAARAPGKDAAATKAAPAGEKKRAKKAKGKEEVEPDEKPSETRAPAKKSKRGSPPATDEIETHEEPTDAEPARCPNTLELALEAQA